MAIGYDSDVSREKVPILSLERGRKKKSILFFFFPDQFNLFRTINRLVRGRNQTTKRIVCFAAWGQGNVCGGKCQGLELALQLGSPVLPILAGSAPRGPWAAALCPQTGLLLTLC